MKKTLRFSLVALFAVLGMSNAMAQDVTIDFTDSTNPWGFPTDYETTEKSYTYGGITITINASNGHKYNTTDKYLIFGKANATLTFPAFSFDVETIKVYGRTGASGKVTQNIFVGDNAVSTETTGATGTNIYKIADAYQAASNIYVLKVTNGNNTQITKIEIFKKGSGVKENSELSWGIGSRDVTIGADDNIFPELSNPHSLSVTYTSSNEDVATIDGTGDITLVAAGQTLISAIFAGDDTYEAATVSYTLNVKEAEPEKTDISNTEETAYTVAKAVELIDDPNSDLTKEVYVKGKISQIDKYNDDKTITYWISDDGTTTNQFECYHGKGLEGADFTATADLKKGATVIVKGKMKKYNTTYEFDSGNVLVSYDESTAVEEANIKNTAETAYTVAKAKDLIEAGEGLATEVYVKGIITKVESYNSKYKSLTYWISDDGTETSQQFEIYSGLAKEGEEFSSKDDLAVGGKVVVKGLLKKFIKGEETIYEMDKNNHLISYEAPATGISALTIDTDVNAPMYNLKGERVDANYRGVVIKGGKKTIQK